MNYEWQSQFDVLQNAHAQNRLSHAYLLSGMAGIGKTDFARKIAAFLLGGSLETHPDFIEITPDDKSHSIKIDQIRTLSDQLSRTSHRGGYQVAVISPADAMPVGAANALLKTLEEPQGKVVIFLVDDQKHPLPKTIESRCQKIYFNASAERVLKNVPEKLQTEILQHAENVLLRGANPITPVSAWAKNDLSDMLDILFVFCQKKLRQKNTQSLHAVLKLILEKKKFVAQGINLNTQLCLEAVFIAISAAG